MGEGAREFEVALESTRAMVRAIADTFPHTELMDTWTWFQTGINTDGAHNPLTTRRVQKGDILIVTEDGAENITAFPFGPEFNILPA